MNTPAHLIIGAAAFAKPDARAINIAAILGALIPDFSLYFMVFWNRNVRGMSFDQIFDVAYFSTYWQAIFAVDNSIPLWFLVLVIGLVARWRVMMVLAAAALLHIALDLPLHHDDGRAHFWPFSDWIFESPISYWDGRHYGWIVGPLEGLLCLGLLVLLWRRFSGWFARVLIMLGGAMECVPAILFPLMFSGPGA